MDYNDFKVSSVADASNAGVIEVLGIEIRMGLPIKLVILVLNGPVSDDFWLVTSEHHQDLLNDLDIEHESSQPHNQSRVICVLSIEHDIRREK